MYARLRIVRDNAPTRVEHLGAGQVWGFGRAPGNPLWVDEASLSRRHLEFSYQAGAGWACNDLGSKNGTLLDGQPFTSGILPSHCWLQPGDLLVEFHELDDAAWQRSLARGDALTAASMDLRQALDPALGADALCRRTLDAVTELVDAERACLLWREQGSAPPDAGTDPASAFRMVAASGGDSFSGSTGALRQALTSGQPVVAADTRGLGALAARHSVLAGNIAALLALPLYGDSSGDSSWPRALLYCDSSRPGRTFSHLELEVLADLANHAVAALELAASQAWLDAAARQLAAASGVPEDDLWQHLLHHGDDSSHRGPQR